MSHTECDTSWCKHVITKTGSPLKATQCIKMHSSDDHKEHCKECDGHTYLRRWRTRWPAAWECTCWDKKAGLASHGRGLYPSSMATRSSSLCLPPHSGSLHKVNRPCRAKPWGCHERPAFCSASDHDAQHIQGNMVGSSLHILLW